MPDQIIRAALPAVTVRIRWSVVQRSMTCTLLLTTPAGVCGARVAARVDVIGARAWSYTESCVRARGIMLLRYMFFVCLFV